MVSPTGINLLAYSILSCYLQIIFPYCIIYRNFKRMAKLTQGDFNEKTKPDVDICMLCFILFHSGGGGDTRVILFQRQWYLISAI